MKLNEIVKLSKDAYRGGYSDLKYHPIPDVKLKPLPGHDSLKWYYNLGGIFVVAEGESHPIAMMELTPARFPASNASEVSAITTHERYRGMGIAQALYKLALMPKPQGLGRLLIAGDSQTPGGRKNWVRLSKMPNVEVSGWVALSKSIDDNPNIDKEYLDQLIDDMLGKIGVQEFGSDAWYAYYEFPLAVSKTKVENLVKNTLVRIYNDVESGDVITGLMAKYVG